MINLYPVSVNLKYRYFGQNCGFSWVFLAMTSLVGMTFVLVWLIINRLRTLAGAVLSQLNLYFQDHKRFWWSGGRKRLYVDQTGVLNYLDELIISGQKPVAVEFVTFISIIWTLSFLLLLGQP